MLKLYKIYPNRRPRIIISAALIFSLFASFPSVAQTYKWNSLAIGGGGFVSALLTNKKERNLMYARTDVGGAYRWDPVNSTWIPLNDWSSVNETGYLGVESFASDPQTPNKFYMLVGISYFNGGKTAILRSDDYGKTFAITDVSALFKAHGNGMGRQNGEKLQVDPNNGNILYCGSRRNGLFKSTNSGVTWTRVTGLNITSTPNDNGISFVYIDPSSGTRGSASQTIYVGISRATSPNVYVSKDGGVTFNALAGAPSGAYMPQRVSVSNEGIMYLNFSNGAGPNGNSGSEPMSNGAIWKFNTKTSAWTNVTPAGISRAWGGISVDPANSNRIIATTINNYQQQGNQGYGDRIYFSTNGGSNWTDIIAARGHVLNTNGVTWISGHAIHWAGSIEFDPFDTKKVWVTSGNGIFSNANIDASNTWKFDVKGVEETVPLDFISIPNGLNFSVIGDYDGFKHSDPTIYAPIHNPRTGTTTGIAYAALNTNKLLRVGNSMYYSANQGTSWTQCSINGVKGKVAISANGNTFLHCPETGTTTYRSTNNGSSWSTCAGLNVGGAFPLADPVNSNKFYVYNNGTVYVSTDGGATFTAGGNAGSGGSRRMQTAPGREGHLWIPLGGGGLTRSVNSAQSFTRISSVSNCAAVGLGKAAPGAAYFTIYIWGTVNGVTGVFRSINEGASWIRVNDDNHEYGGPGNGQFVIGDMNVYGRVYMSTAGRGVAYGDLSTVTSLDNSLETLYDENVIAKCYPNPFSIETTINAPGSFSYHITDIQGREVESGRGENSVNAGSNLVPGLYLLKVESERGNHISKIQKK